MIKNNYKYFFIILGFAILVFVIVSKRPALAPEITPNVAELCFAKYGQVMPNPKGFEDKYILSLSIVGDKVTGELKFLPAEKDSKVGKFTGTVSAVDKIMMARTINAMWDTLAEGTRATEELKIIFGEGTASIGMGEMIARSDGVYMYKDPANIKYNLQLTDVACSDLTEQTNVENYLRANIAKLSPVKAVLGGTWYVLSVNVDPTKNSGNVTYEDGHIQENKNFTYTVDENSKVTNLVIGSASVTSSSCYVGGCSSQICSDQKDVVSTCIYKAEYACYKTATCERQNDGKCSWTQSPELTACIKASVNTGPIIE